MSFLAPILAKFAVSVAQSRQKKAREEEKKRLALDKRERQLAKDEKTTREQTLKNKITFHKEASQTLPDNHPDKFYHSYQIHNTRSILHEDPTMKPLSPEEYKDQFMMEAYPPEEYSTWNNFKSSTSEIESLFGPDSSHKEQGRAQLQYTSVTDKIEEQKGKAEDLGKGFEADLKAKLNSLEKRKGFAERYLQIQDMTEEEVQAGLKMTKQSIQTGTGLGKLSQLLTGDANVIPIWTDKDQKEYNSLVAQFNRSQELQGTGYTWRDVQGRSEVRQLEEMGLKSGEDFTKRDIPSTEFEGDGAVMKTKPRTTIDYNIESPAVQELRESRRASLGEDIIERIDSLEAIRKRLRKRYPNLNSSFDEIDVETISE